MAVGFVPLAVPYMCIIKGISNKPALGEGEAEVAAQFGPLFAMWIPKDSVGLDRLPWAIWACVSEWLKVGHYGVAVLAVTLYSRDLIANGGPAARPAAEEVAEDWSGWAEPVGSADVQQYRAARVRRLPDQPAEVVGDVGEVLRAE